MGIEVEVGNGVFVALGPLSWGESPILLGFVRLLASAELNASIPKTNDSRITTVISRFMFIEPP
jgi:hypothetical protein